jgi:hypothetical protein
MEALNFGTQGFGNAKKPEVALHVGGHCRGLLCVLDPSK